MATHKVLSTKRLEPSLTERAKQAGVEIFEQEAISIRPIWSEEKFAEVSSCFQKLYVAFTSANAVSIADDYLHPHDTFYVPGWKIFCLSGKTKAAVLKALVLPKTITGEAGNAAELAEEIIRQQVKEIVFFCGNKRRNELPEQLKKAGVRVHEVVLYETVETAQPVSGDVDAILFFSPSAVHSFFSANQLKPGTVCFAVGRTTKHSILPFTDNEVITCLEPGQEEMIDEVISYFKNKVSAQD